MTVLKRILVATDFSKNQKVLLKMQLIWQKHLGRKLHLHT